MSASNRDVLGYVGFAVRCLHEMNLFSADHVCLSVRVIQFEKRWTDLDDLSYERYAIGNYSKILLFGFLQSAVPAWLAQELVWWDLH